MMVMQGHPDSTEASQLGENIAEWDMIGLA